MTERGGVVGRHTAKATAGASVARPEKDSAPISASASLPAIARLYNQANNTTARIPTRRCISTAPRRSPPSPPCAVAAQGPRTSSGVSQWLPIITLSASVARITMPVAALRPPRNATNAKPWLPCDKGRANT